MTLRKITRLIDLLVPFNVTKPFQTMGNVCQRGLGYILFVFALTRRDFLCALVHPKNWEFQQERIELIFFFFFFHIDNISKIVLGTYAEVGCSKSIGSRNIVGGLGGVSIVSVDVGKQSAHHSRHSRAHIFRWQAGKVAVDWRGWGGGG